MTANTDSIAAASERSAATSLARDIRESGREREGRRSRRRCDPRQREVLFPSEMT